MEDLEDDVDDYRTWDNFGCGEYETYEEHYTTKSGDKIVAFGYYGNGY